MAVCNKTGGIAIYNPDRNMFMSPLADGPLKYVDSFDKTSTNIEHVTKFGRSFSVVRIPYVFKLFLQELQTINVKMAIITEDNVDQFDNMNFSKNISLLTNKRELEGVIEDISKDMNKKIKKNNYDELLAFIEDSDSSPELNLKPAEKSPEPNSPQGYVPNSPQGYVPNSPQGYVPNSPQGYVPNSPGYVPNSMPSIPPSPVDSPIESPPWHISSDEYIPMGKGVMHKPNDFVLFNGDFKPDRPWRINSFDKGFAILETADTEGLSSNTKVVALSDIRPYVQPQQPQPQQMGNSQPPVVVNVIAGDNNSMEPKTETVDFSKPKIRFSENNDVDTSSDASPMDNFSSSKSIIVKKV
jgi:hypothetical protein